MGHDNAFGQLIRQRRRTLDLTQDELARRVGCAAVTLRKGVPSYIKRRP